MGFHVNYKRLPERNVVVELVAELCVKLGVGEAEGALKVVEESYHSRPYELYGANLAN